LFQTGLAGRRNSLHEQQPREKLIFQETLHPRLFSAQIGNPPGILLNKRNILQLKIIRQAVLPDKSFAAKSFNNHHDIMGNIGINYLSPY
jgi:hypothetical protein